MEFKRGDPATTVTVPREVFDELISLWLGVRSPSPLAPVSSWILTFLEAERTWGPL